MPSCRTVKESREGSNVLNRNELTYAENVWIRRAQDEAFPQDEKEKALLQLNPQTDKYGILRVNGQLKCADDLPYDARHPILIPRRHLITKLLIRSNHEKLGHGTGEEHSYARDFGS